MNGKSLEEVERSRHLGVDMVGNVTLGADVCHRVGEEAKIMVTLGNVWKESHVQYGRNIWLLCSFLLFLVNENIYR